MQVPKCADFVSMMLLFGMFMITKIFLLFCCFFVAFLKKSKISSRENRMAKTFACGALKVNFSSTCRFFYGWMLIFKILTWEPCFISYHFLLLHIQNHIYYSQLTRLFHPQNLVSLKCDVCGKNY